MRGEEIEHGKYTEVEYFQFRAWPVYRFVCGFLGVLTWPAVLPMALLSRISDSIFRTFSEIVSMVPFLVGFIVRYEFYRFSLRSCGHNVLVDFGTLFLYRDVCIGSNVYIASYVTVHHCDIGDYVLISEGCSLLSGSRYHHFDRSDIPIALQGGAKIRICLGTDSWIGARSVIMADVGTGSIVGAGSVVTRPVQPYTVVVGNPARLVRRRDAR